MARINCEWSASAPKEPAQLSGERPTTGKEDAAIVVRADFSLRDVGAVLVLLHHLGQLDHPGWGSGLADEHCAELALVASPQLGQFRGQELRSLLIHNSNDRVGDLQAVRHGVGLEPGVDGNCHTANELGCPEDLVGRMTTKPRAEVSCFARRLSWS